MMPIPFMAIVPGLGLAALTPAKVTDEKTNSSAMRSVHQPKVIYVKSFSIRDAASHSDDSAGAGRPFVMSKREPEREAKKVAKSIAAMLGKFMVAQGIPTLESTESR